MTNMKKSRKDVSGKTNCSDDSSFIRYMKDISHIPLLDKEEEEKIARLAAQGDKRAREKLVNANLRFVILIAKKFQGQGLPIEDLISEGNLGLLNAVDRFDPEKGFRFITYAVWWIRQAIIRGIWDKSRLIRLPSSKASDLSKLNKSRRDLEGDPGRKFAEEIREAAAFLEITPEKAEDLLRISQDVISLQEPLKGDIEDRTAPTLMDFLEDRIHLTPEQYALNNVLKADLDNALGALEKKASDVLRCRYGLGEDGPLTLAEVGANFGLSRERVRQIESRALIQLKKSSISAHLDSYIAG